MSRPPDLRLRRRGVALLLVLASLVVGLSAVSVLASARLSAKLASDAHERSSVAEAAIDAALPMIEAWLAEASASVVLPPSDAPPRVVLFDQQLASSLRIAVTAWDQCGMRPLEDASLPGRRATSAATTGLDQLEPDSDGAVFPSPDRDAFQPPAIGERFATHNPPPTGSAGRDTRAAPWLINANTAPVELIRDVFRESQRGGLDLLIERRRAGEPAIVGLLEPRTASGRPVQLVSASSVWSFRIDATAHGVTRLWWLVYTRDTQRWRLVQRVRIDR